MPQSPLIELDQVERSYPLANGRSWVLRRIALRVEPGEFVSITGPSGSGKSSLLNIIGMLDAGFEGEYRFEGQSLRQLDGRRRQALQRDRIGFIFQHYHLINDLSVAENLDLPLSYRNVPAAERRARVAEMLDRFGMAARRDLYPNQLSGGQQQLLAVARAIIGRPALLLADEPTGALHSSQAREVMELLAALNREGMTVIQVTHNPDCAACGRRQVALRDGWIESDSGQPA